MSPATRSDRLRRAFERARTVPGLGRNVVILLVLIALGLGTGGYMLARQPASWPWQDEFRFAAVFESAPGVRTGGVHEVRIAGVPVGEIQDASVTEDGRARLVLTVERGEHTIYRNARLVLRPKSPLNDMYVEVDPGEPPAAPLSEGDTLSLSRTRRPVQVDEVLAHLDSRSRAALTSLLTESDVALARAPSTLPRGLRQADSMLADLRPAVRALATRRAKLAELVTAMSRISHSVGDRDVRLARLARSLQDTLAVIARRDGQLEESLRQMPGLSGDLRDATAEVSSLSGELDPALAGLRRSSTTLPPALRRLTHTMDRLGALSRTARPVVSQARPVVADLRPLVGDMNAALADAQAVTPRLDPVTRQLLPYLDDLGAFVYNTNAMVSLEDANGGILRGHFVFPEELVGDLEQYTKAGKGATGRQEAR